MKQPLAYLNAQEIALHHLPGLPTTKRGVNKLARTQGWPSRPRSGRGGGVEFPVVCLPVSAQNALCQITIQGKTSVNTAGSADQPNARQTSNATTASSNVANAQDSIESVALTGRQRQIADARAAFLREVERIALLVGREKAVKKLVAMAQDGTLPEHLVPLVSVANAKAGATGKRTLSRRTLYRWLTEASEGADTDRMQVNALAPKDQHAAVRIPSWASDLLAEFQQPQKPNLTQVVERIAPLHGIEPMRLYHRARRFLDKMGNVERQAGRMGAREIKNVKPFVRRDSSTLWPSDVYSADGHTFDAEVAHPVHGKAFRAEITTVRDVATRKVVGWSVDLAESGLAVLDALRHACETGGICSLFYVDNGSGYKNALQSAPGIGMEARLGFTKTHSLPYNSQARGIVEKGHKDIWVRAAKELPTYMGADMDAEAKNRVFKLTRKDVKASGTSRYLMPWPRFVEFVRAHAEKYNDRPHRSLPMVFDEVLGRKRHKTPNEAWADGVAAGAQLVTLSEDEARDLFRPMKEVKVIRGEIRLFNNLYFSTDLTEYHGDVMRVAYDIHNPDKVWVYDEKGRFVCTALFEANKRAYFPESVLEQATRKRVEGQVRRLENKLADARLGLEPRPVKDLVDLRPALDPAPSPLLKLVDPIDVEFVDAPETKETERPLFFIDSERYEWLMEHRGEWNAADRLFLQRYIDDPQGYCQLAERFELLGIAWEQENGSLKKVI